PVTAPPHDDGGVADSKAGAGHTVRAGRLHMWMRGCIHNNFLCSKLVEVCCRMARTSCITSGPSETTRCKNTFASSWSSVCGSCCPNLSASSWTNGGHLHPTPARLGRRRNTTDGATGNVMTELDKAFREALQRGIDCERVAAGDETWGIRR